MFIIRIKGIMHMAVLCNYVHKSKVSLLLPVWAPIQVAELGRLLTRHHKYILACKFIPVFLLKYVLHMPKK